MISRLGALINEWFRRVCPDPFILAIGLTVLTGFLAWMIPNHLSNGELHNNSVSEIVGYWQGGFWNLLKFSMQMCLILVTGHALASSPPISRILRKLAGLPRTGIQATILVAGVAMLLAVLNWGLGLIGGAMLAREVGKSMQERGVRHHYPLLAAAGYLGLLVWHGGFSGSAPLKVTKIKEIEEVFAGLDINFTTIPFDQTIFSSMNFVLTGGLIAIALLVIAQMVPRGDQSARGYGEFDVNEPKPIVHPEIKTFPDWLEGTPWMVWLLAAPMFLWLGDLFILGSPDGINSLEILPEEAGSSWKALTPDHVNLLFLALGLVMHGTPRRYLRAVDEAVRGCAGIILQFPLYAGIMGIMAASGLAATMAGAIADWSTETTLPLMTFLSAGVVNLFVPSGGGQWAVQGPIAMQAASEMGYEGAAYAKMVMAVAYGDQLTNMLQPFWALPLLGITGVKARDIVGYTAVVMVAGGVWLGVMLVLW